MTLQGFCFQGVLFMEHLFNDRKWLRLRIWQLKMRGGESCIRSFLYEPYIPIIKSDRKSRDNLVNLLLSYHLIMQ